MDTLTDLDWRRLEDVNHDVALGGSWRPEEGDARHNVAVIIPYRDRELSLYNFLSHVHSFLKRQKIAYTMYLVEQAPGKVFNRGLVKNVGFLEVTRLDGDHNCVVFHDVDLLPLDYRNEYACVNLPRHMCLATDYFENFKPLYLDDYANFGGVVAFSMEQFVKVNGYSNIYVGWGAEDDDLYRRVIHEGYTINRYDDDVGRYYGVKHKSEKKQNHPHYPADRFKLLRVAEERISRDGINTAKYQVLNITKEKLFTRIYIDVEQDVYLSQAKDEEIVYSQLYGNLSPYWKKLNFTPKPYWWKQHSGRKKEIQKET